MRAAFSEAVPDQRPRQKGMFLFALVFALVAVCSLSFYYAQLGLTQAPVASAGHTDYTREAAVGDEPAAPPGALEELRGQKGTAVGLE